MKIKRVICHRQNGKIPVYDAYVKSGYVKRQHGSLPDVDVDFDSERRQEVKEYLEKRHNKNGTQRVFSAGTFITEKIKSVIKDVSRVHKISVSTVNYINAILDDDLTWTELMRLCVTNKKVRDFVQRNWQVFEDVLPLMGQPRSSGVHASAVIITPEIVKGRKVECFDLLPIKKMDGLLVSELSGNDIDAIGILKNDILGIKELSRLSEMLNIVKEEYGVSLTMLHIITQKMGDDAVFDVLRRGMTQGIFQMSSGGMTRFLKQMNPSEINDLIAANALFRPATLNSGAANTYVDCKNGLIEPEYLWGTYEILKDTYGVAIYQEQFAMLVRKIGNLSIGDGVNLVKAISKKKIEKIRKYKSKYLDGIKVTGCPIEAAEKVWETIEAAASYAFNRSHATAYALTAYVGAWLKTYYPIAFYTVFLKSVSDEKLAQLLNEIQDYGKANIANPNINISDIGFVTDYKNNRIYWSFGRIKYLGVTAIRYIVKDRSYYGDFDSLEDFIKRIFKHRNSDAKTNELVEKERCPVNVRHVRNLIISGAFDECENIASPSGRYELIKKASEMLGSPINEADFPTNLVQNDWFWSQQQIIVSGFGAIDYKGIVKGISRTYSLSSYKYVPLKDLMDMDYVNMRAIVCATIAEVEEKSFKDKETGEKKMYGKITLRQNTDNMRLLIWNDAWSEKRPYFYGKTGSIVVVVALVKYSDYDGENILQTGKRQFAINI